MMRAPSQRDWSMILLSIALIGGTLASIVLLAIPAWAAEFSGRAERIVDGDTFWVCDAACSSSRSESNGHLR